jgi:hypothetical protein
MLLDASDTMVFCKSPAALALTNVHRSVAFHVLQLFLFKAFFGRFSDAAPARDAI